MKLSPAMIIALGKLGTEWALQWDVGVLKVTLDALVDRGYADSKLEYNATYKKKFRWYRLAQKEIVE